MLLFTTVFIVCYCFIIVFIIVSIGTLQYDNNTGSKFFTMVKIENFAYLQ